MDPVYLFNLASKQQSWLSVRQAIVAENIANANTPGFEARDVAPFNKVLDEASIEMASTSDLHLSKANFSQREIVKNKANDSWETTASGNSVSLESEMIKAGDIRTTFALNASVIKAFHGMWLASVKG